MIPWESLRPKLKASLITGGLRASDVARKSPAGRKPWDEVVIFKAPVLQALTIFRTIRRNTSFATARALCASRLRLVTHALAVVAKSACES